MEKISFSGEHLLGVINNILDISKIERHSVNIYLHEFELSRVKDYLLNVFSISAKEKNLTIDIDFSEDIPKFIFGDIQKLNQILLNLVGNAIKFTKNGTIEVNAYIANESANEYRVKFNVKDSGVGINDDQKQNIFIPFTQGDSSITRSFEGTGLGLSICKQLVELMNGTIGFESQAGNGSHFWFELPFGKVLTQKPDNTPLSTHTSDNSLLKGTRILLAEDNHTNQIVAVKLLERVGAKVVVASNGYEVIDLVLANRLSFDCILMDMQMPEMDGVEATKRIRELYSNNELPILAMTANISQEDRNLCKAAGMDDFISKPIIADLLYSTIAQSLGFKKKLD